MYRWITNGNGLALTYSTSLLYQPLKLPDYKPHLSMHLYSALFYALNLPHIHRQNTSTCLCDLGMWEEAEVARDGQQVSQSV